VGTPRIAVILSCYNLGRTLPEALASARSQSLPPDEVVIVDDGSSDPYTRQVLARLEREGHWVVHTSNRGVSAARNLGVRLTSAPYLVLLDADDLLAPTYLEKASARLEAEPDLSFVSCRMRGFGAARYEWSPPDPELVEAIAKGVVHVSSMFRRAMWETVGGFDEELPAFEEMDFWTTVLEQGFRGEVLGEALLHYRVRPESMYHGAIQPEAHLDLMSRFYAKHRDTIDRHGESILLAKERFLLSQREHARHLAERQGQVERELDVLQQRIAEVEQELRVHGSRRVEWGDLRRTTPISPVWGLDRGLPVDRHFIEAFLGRHRRDVRGSVLEIKDAGYTRMLGDDRVTRSEVLDVNPHNELATIVADLTRGEQVPGAAFDCFILTQTLNVVYDVRAALETALRALKPGGVLLCTVSALNRISYEDRGLDGDYWRFTEGSLRELFAEQLGVDSFEITGYGNVASCTAFLYGLAAHELTEEELGAHDPYFPLVYGVRAVKPGESAHPSRLSGPSAEPRATILMYHRTGEPARDPHGLCLPPWQLRQQLRHVLGEYQPMALGGLANALISGSLPDRAVAVTFDDGYLDNLTEASDILLELGIPATFFVTGEGLAGEREYWWDTLARIFLAWPSLPNRLELRVADDWLRAPTGDPDQRRRAHDMTWEAVSLLPPEDRDEVIDALLRWSGSPRGPFDGVRPITEQELLRLANRPGHTIGAHTEHHLRLTAQPEAIRRAEVFANKQRLEKLLGVSPSLFSYPFGERDDALVRLVREAGFVAAVTAEEGWIERGADPLLLPRIEIRSGPLVAFERRLDELFTRRHDRDAAGPGRAGGLAE